MDTIRIARDLGDVSAVLPDGIDSLADAPYNLLTAIGLALIFLSFEEHAPEDRPPKSIWLDKDEMDAHWGSVRRRWREKGSSRDYDEPIEDPVENLAAKQLITGL